MKKLSEADQIRERMAVLKAEYEELMNESEVLHARSRALLDSPAGDSREDSIVNFSLLKQTGKGLLDLMRRTQAHADLIGKCIADGEAFNAKQLSRALRRGYRFHRELKRSIEGQ